MKYFLFIFFMLIISCKKSETTIAVEKLDSVATPQPDVITEPKPTPAAQVFENARFRKVTVNKSGDIYEISGEAQIFEASFSWVIEDGHDELASGHEMTDAGAPEWGKFRFTVNPEKARQNSTLTLVLFEISAKDGSRQHELPIPLI